MFRKPDGAGKGDVPRPIQDYEKFSNNWDQIFNKHKVDGNNSMPDRDSTDKSKQVSD
jgi:hypothetical protein